MEQAFDTDVLKRAYVVDDDTSFRRSLILLLEAAGWQVRGFASGPEFLEECQFLPPGALLLDIRMPEMSGLEMLERESKSLMNFAVIIVTGHGDVNTAVRSLKRGAVDFIEKPFDGLELLSMLDNSYKHLLNSIEHSRREQEAASRVDHLSSRERDVLRGLLAGASHKLIARHFGISDRTVEMYRNNMVRKLGARSTNEALHLGVLARLKPIEL
jgi:two-component system, LuxR family, response regulator FixJ